MLDVVTAAWFAILLALLVAALASRAVGGLGAGPLLALKRFAVNDAPGSPALVEIVGRASGLTGWVLGLSKVGTETSFVVTERNVVFRSRRLGGESHHVVPLSAVSSTQCGYAKPVWALVLGTLSVAFGFIGLLAVLVRAAAGSYRVPNALSADVLAVLLYLLAGGALLAWFAFRRTLVIRVESSGGLVPSLAFKRSIVENVTIDLPNVIAAVKAINHRLPR